VRAALLRGAYYIFGLVYRLLWQSGVISPRGNRWHAQRAGVHVSRRKNPLWLHAASMGEVAVAAAYADALLVLAPLYLTVQTRAGMEAAKRLLPHVPCAYAPFDSPRTVKRFLRGVAPCGLVVFETEIWPYWLKCFTGPVWFANARLSRRSQRGYRLARPALKPLWRSVRGVYAQSEGDRDRFVALGLPPDRVRIAGQVKQFQHAPIPSPLKRAAWRTRLGIDERTPLWVCGSVRSDEVELVVRMWQGARRDGRSPKLILAPRHLERVALTCQAVEAAGASVRRISTINGQPPERVPDVYVLDTHGDLASVYAACDLALLGGTFGPHGGHNPNEAAHYGVPVITGPFTGNIEGDLPLLAAAGLCYRLEDVGDFAALIRDFHPVAPAEACARLSELMTLRKTPVAMLAEDVRAELGRRA